MKAMKEGELLNKKWGGFALSLAPPLHPSHIEYSISIDADLKTSGNASVYFF